MLGKSEGEKIQFLSLTNHQLFPGCPLLSAVWGLVGGGGEGGGD